MSKIEEMAKAYRGYREECGVGDPVMLNEIEEAYFEGYHQAEKDLELTWEDIERIFDIHTEIKYEDSISLYSIEFYQEVLKRFKAQKGK